jgi:hypothetical protein
MMDEFEKLEQKMDQGTVSQSFLEHLRYLMQHRRELIVILAGHHTLQERLTHYWDPLMEIARPLQVGYLDETAARNLITDPWDEFRLQYAEEEIQRLMQATGRQPMLLQLACSNVIRQVNERIARPGASTMYPTAQPGEVEAALNRFLETEETFYFRSVWDWLTEEQQATMKRLAWACQESDQNWVDYQTIPGLDKAILQLLVDRQVLKESSGRYRFQVELVQQWVARNA